MEDLIQSVIKEKQKKIFLINSSDTDEELKSEYIEGAENVPLPSKGLFYKFNKKFENSSSIKVRKLTYEDEDILTTKSYLEDGSVFIELLNSVIVDKEIRATSLVPIDRDTLLLWLRSTSFGNHYEIDAVCPRCNGKNIIAWDLSELEIPEYDKEVLLQLEEKGEYEIITPLKGVKVFLSVPTLGKTKQFEKFISLRKEKEKLKSDLFGTASLLVYISGVEVTENETLRDRTEIDRYFRKISLPISDTRFIRKQIDKVNLKYETKKTMECIHCNHIQEGVELPIGHSNFFWSEF